MTYCMADIHGQLDSYKKLLEVISLRPEDDLFLLGDVLDRGERPCEALLDIMRRPNVTLLAGNHEYASMLVLPKLMRKITNINIEKFLDDTDFMENFLAWQGDGGNTTIDSFSRLSQQERQAVLAYLGELPLYKEITVNGQTYILVHAGLSNFSPTRPLEEYSLWELVFERPDYSTPYYGNKIVVTGHTPTRKISAHNGTDTIYVGNNHIAIDCGAVFGGTLAAICLETGEQFYV